MTLTEEQRGTVGFDLEKAREAVHILENFAFASGKITAGQIQDVTWGARLLAASTAEIERLRAENLELQVAVFGPDGIRANQACIIADQAARISDLEIEITGLKADLEQSEEIKRLKDELENYGDHYACLLISKDAQIKELEGMLSIRTEELDIAHSVARSEKEMHEKELAAFARRIKEQDDALVEERARVITSHPLTHVIDEDRTEASMQLQAEGKIGPDATKPQSWQITEERKAAIDRGLQFLEWSYAKNSAHDTKEQIAVLWAMLDEDTHGKP